MASIRLIAWLSLSFIASTASSQGLLDFADPCVKGTQSFQSTSQALRERADAVVADWEKLQDPPADLFPLYQEAAKLGLYNSWVNHPQTAPLIQILTQSTPTFDSKAFFLEKVYPTAITPDQEKDLVRGVFKADYGTRLRPQLLANRKDIDDQIQKQKDSLDGSCKNGEFDKIFRATIGNFAGIVASNFAASANEKGDIAKAVRGLSGVSLTDIQQFGILGGPDSELNKALNDALGNSDLKKVITGLASALDPSKWKIETPKIELPQLPNAPQLPNIPLPQLPNAPEVRIELPKVDDLPKLPSCCKW